MDEFDGNFIKRGVNEMGQAKRRGSFEERKNAAIIRDETFKPLRKELQAKRDEEADKKSYDSEKPYRGIPVLEPYFNALALSRLI